jgi:hypothetical protein
MNKIYEELKIDIGLVSQALNNTNVTGKYHSMAEYRKAIAILSGGAMAATKTTKLEIFEAKDADGTSGALITGAAATITANTNVTELTITLATVLAAETIIINGLTFTAHGTVTTYANREFKIDGNDTADAAELVKCINIATAGVYGVPGVTASSAAAVITLLATDPGEKKLTVSSTDATFTIATTKAQAYVEFDDYDLSAGFTHIACKVTTTANSNIAVILLRDSVGAITQQMGASALI